MGERNLSSPLCIYWERLTFTFPTDKADENCPFS